ncbi:MAG: YncE family protein [Nitrososphaera sp.]
MIGSSRFSEHPPDKIGPMRTRMVLAISLIIILILPSQLLLAAADADSTTIPIEIDSQDGYYSYSIAVNERTNTAYATHPNSDYVSVIDTATNSIIKTIQTDHTPIGIAVNPNTNFIYVGNSGSGIVSVIDGSVNEIVSTLKVTNQSGFYAIGGVAVNQRTDKVYVLTNEMGSSGNERSHALITVINGSTNKIEQTFKVDDLRLDFDVIDDARGLAVNSETGMIYVSMTSGSLYVIDGSDNKVMTSVVLGTRGHGEMPTYVAVNEKTNTVFVSLFGSHFVSVINGSDNRVIGSVDIGELDPQGLAVDESADSLFVASAGGISIVNTASLELHKTVAAGRFPVGLAYSSNNRSIYVANWGSKFFSVIPAPKAPEPSAPFAPIVITKVDPWAPLRGLDERTRPCLPEDSLGQVDGFAYAWIELTNIKNKAIATTGPFTIEVRPVNPLGIGGAGSDSEFPGRLVLEPNESCIISTANLFSTRLGVGGSEGSGPPPGADKDGATVSINYSINDPSIWGGEYSDSTPALSDPYGDLAYWELDADSGRWIFRDDLAGMRNLTNITLTQLTSPGSVPVIVNLTMPEEIRAPSVVKLELSFFNATTRQLINDNVTTVVYEIEYKDSPLPNATEKYNGQTSTGSDVKYFVANQTGSIDIAVKITALNREAAGGSFDHLDTPETARFTAVVVPEFGTALADIIIAAISLAAMVLAVRIKMSGARAFSG